MTYKLFLPLLLILGCSSTETSPENSAKVVESDTRVASTNPVDSLFQSYKNLNTPSISRGLVNNGSLENGVTFPFSGSNYHYFDTISYLQKRGFVNNKVRDLVLAAYDSLYHAFPNNTYGLMECSNEHGGKIWPHKTHQNGLSVDFMSPLLKGEKQSTIYDYIGTQHYFMEFDEHGVYVNDRSHQIDFELMAQHLAILHFFAPKYGLKVNKVIFKLNLKDELFATKTGKIIQKKLYFAQNLSNLINNLHDDHYHVDFELIR